MNKKYKHGCHRLMTMLLAVITVFSAFGGTAFAVQEYNYHDPAEHWLEALNRTNEFDRNAVVTRGNGTCAVCGHATTFITYRVPEYTRDGITAATRNVRYSDGTLVGGEGTGLLMSGTPGKDSFYTGYHWTKACCNTCGTINSNMGIGDYCFGKNVYYLYDCAPEFFEDLDETVTFTSVDSAYHTKTTKSGSYCGYCYGTNHKDSAVLERHNMQTEVIPQISNNRFAIVKHCKDCEYTSTSYVGAKSVIADYYGVVDGKSHTITISDLSEAGVSTQIRYGNSAESCTLTSAPNYTEKGQYAVYYEITYSYSGMTMTENGVANVWLHDEKEDTDCPCGCGDPDCDCKNPDCNGSCHKGNCVDKHNFVVLEPVNPTCKTLGYTRYLCVDCGKVEKRDYVDSLDHSWQTIVIREATCEMGGKTLKVCKNCGEVQENLTPKGEHKYATYTVEPTCVNPGYKVKECEICGDRHITDIQAAKPHNYEAIVTPANCENGGYTLHLCQGCGSSFTTDFTDPLGHSFDEGTVVTSPSCTGEGVTEFRCERCGYHYIDGNTAVGHKPGDAATCTKPQLCTVCGAVIHQALGHSYKSEITAPTCTDMGFTTFVCERCGETYKSDYVKANGHKVSDWIIDKEPTTSSEGSKHKECEVCGEKLETATIEKLYLTATTDSKGEAVVGGYLVIVTDTDTTEPVSGAKVMLNEGGDISIRLPNSRILDYADQTTVTVKLVKDNSPVNGLSTSVTDKFSNYSAGMTSKNGQLIVPGKTENSNDDGKATIGGKDSDGDCYTITVKVEDYETGRPIEDAAVSIGKTGTITVKLPEDVDMDENNRIIVTVTDNEQNPLKDKSIVVKGDLGQNASGKTDEDGRIVVPAVIRTMKHGAYIVGYPDGTFGPEKDMTRSEAAAIFARLLAERKGETLPTSGKTHFKDTPNGAWYSGAVRYLTEYGVTFGTGENNFAPDRSITRAEFVTMAVRFFNVYGEGNTEIMEQYAEFTDVPNGYWAAEYIRDAAIHGWIYGYGDGTFRAESKTTRAEVVSIVNRLLDRTADSAYIGKNINKLNSFPDVSEKHWAYLAIVEAANSHTATFDPAEMWSK